MYQTVKSPTTSWADSATLEPGLEKHAAGVGAALVGIGRSTPVLCAPAALVSPVSALFTSAALSSMQDGADPNTADLSPNTLDFTAAVAYIPPGRLSADTVKVPQNASVEELISAAAAARRA